MLASSLVSRIGIIVRNKTQILAALNDCSRRAIACFLIYSTVLATMPVRANEMDRGSRPVNATYSGEKRSFVRTSRANSVVDQLWAADPLEAIPSKLLTQTQFLGSNNVAVASGSPSSKAVAQKTKSITAQPQTAQAASPCLYVLDPSAQGAFYVSGSTSITTSCSADVESSASQAFQMSGTEILYLQNNAQIGVVGGWNLSGQTKIVNQSTGKTVAPVNISSPGDPLSYLPAPTQGNIVGKSHTSYDMNNKPPNNTLSPGVYCGGLTIGNTNGVTFTMSPGTYIMAGGGLTINSLGIVSGSGVTVYNTSSTGWGCSGSSSYTPITISGQANVTMSAPTTGPLANVVLFGDRAGCATVGSCQDQINSSSSTTFTGATYFKTDTLLISGNNSSKGCMMAVADKININGNSSFVITGCSGTIGGVTVSVTPSTATLYGGQSQQFSATVTNASNTAVSWSISPSLGTINSSGIYTAPSSVTSKQTVTVTATSQAEPTVSASATVTLMPPVSVSVTPTTAALYGGQTQQFSATVSNTNNTAVNWSISPSVGSISSSGLYAAPASVTSKQTVTVTATSQAFPSASASAIVTLMPPVSISISPTSATIYPGQTQQFTATVANTNNTAVTWSSSPSGSGTISSSGLYTAPASITKQLSVTVTVTSQADTTKSASAVVTVAVPLPSITSITSPAAPGSQITISGQNFLSSTGTVTLNGVSVPTSSWSNTSISLQVPTNNCTGPVAVTTQYGTSNTVTLTITGTQPGCTYPPPNANAGPAQTVAIGATVQLDGTGSTDQTGTLLTYSWSFVSVPSGSATTLSNPTSPKPTFVADVYGKYTVQLVVNDGYHNSSPSQVVISTQDSAPVANAGANQSVNVGTTVQLSGSGSTDVDGNPLIYLWSFISVPTGSKSTLTNPSSVNPTFTTDKPGSYTLQLVVNDGILNSTPAMVTISSQDVPPIANAGPNQNVTVESAVQLNGSGSTDVDGNPLTYQWSFLNIPTGSSAALSNPAIVNPTFVADVPGNFVVQLIVNDGILSSAPATVTVGNTDIPPVANAGPAQTVSLGSLVTLDGTGSTDADKKPLTYQWSLLSIPAGSTATLVQPMSPGPSFTADLAGNYVAQLIVNDGYLNSSPSTVTISTSHSVPVANPGPNQTVTVGATVQLSGAASSDVDGYPLTYSWTILSQPTGGSATLSSTTEVDPTFVANAVGMYVVQLIVNDGVYSSPPVTMTVTAAPPTPVVSAGPNQTITLPTNSVTLNGSGTDSGYPLTFAWSVVSGQGTVTFGSVSSAVTSATFSSAGTYVLQLTASNGQNSASSTTTITVNPQPLQPPVVSAGANQTITLPVNTVTLNGSANDNGAPMTLAWSVVSGPGTVTFSSQNSAITGATFSSAGTYVLQLTAINSQFSSSSQTSVTVNPPASLPPVVTAGSNETIPYPNTFPLKGSVTSANNPPGKPTALWSKVSGPPVIFANTTSPATTVQFNSAGTYVLQLTGTEKGLSSSAQLIITAVAGNQPPVVSAGPNQTITLPANSTMLNGSATDDGLPNGTLAIAWSQLAGPSGVTFGAPNQAVTQATFPGVGTYLLQLMANDSQLQSTSDVTVIVQPQPGNQAPVVNAGPNQTIMLPANIVTLQGTATDDGLPNGTLLTTWSQIGGSTPVTIVNPSALSTQMQFTQPGTYVLQLVASDTQLSSSSTMTVLVNSPSPSGTLSLSPTNAGPDVVSAVQTITAVLADSNANPVPGVSVAFVVSGVNAASGSTITDNTGTATFSYQGVTSGTDTVQAEAELSSTLLQSNAGTVSWIVPKRPVSISQVIGKFYLEGAADFSSLPTETPVFTQVFSNLTFNSDPSYPIGPIIPGGTGGVNYGTRPLTNVDVDGSGNFIGTTPAEENSNVSAGLGSLFAFQAVFTGQLTVAHAGNLSFNINSDDSFQFGVGGGAVRVGGYYFQAVASGHSVINDYPLMAAGGGGFAYPRNFTIYFPAPGSYPFEADYYECCGGGLAFILSNATTNPSPLGPTGFLTLTPPNLGSYLAGSSVTVNVVATDGMGFPVPSLPVTLVVKGSNPQQLLATTDNGGNAQFNLSGVNTGADTFQAHARISGPMLTSNQGSVNWTTGGPGVPPVVYAGANQTITLPASTGALNGTASEPGNPNATLTTVWTRVSGPGTVTFSTPNQLATQAAFSAAGTYILQLSATFGQLTTSSTMTITVAMPSNRPPAVSVNPARVTIGLPQNSIVLNGEAADPYGHQMVTTWSEVGGLGNVNLTAPNSLYTIATFPATGAYIVRLTALDVQTQLSASSDVIVTVNPPGNQPPTVSAGSNQTITSSTAALQGNVSDDGLPSNTLLTNWAVVSGPGQVVFSDPAKPATTASFSSIGVYVLRLTANDTQLSTSSDVTITVSSSSGGLVNQAPVVNAGPNQTIQLPQNSVTLNGSATDDGLPTGSTLTTQWTLLSGPSLPIPQNGYTGGRAITINHTLVPNSDLTDFPVLISGTYGFLGSVSNNGMVQNSNGWDIIFTSDSAGQQKLDHEIESYDPVHGTVVFWLTIPSLSHTSDTTFYMWFGNSAINTSQENKAGVWRNGFAGVWHFANSGSGLDIGDSTGNFISNTDQGATAVQGTIGGAAAFNGSSPNQILFPSAGTLSGNFTIEAWLQPTGSDTPSTMGLLGSRSTQADDSFDIHLISTGIQSDIGNGNSWLTNGASGSYNYSMDTWHSLAFVAVPNAYTVYENGSQAGQGAFNGVPLLYDSNHTLRIGATGWPGEYFNGDMDEVRVSSVARSADWLAAEYNNESEPGVFYSIGGVTFSDSSQPVTQATFPVAGTYVMQLSASDTQLTSTATTTVVVEPPPTNNNPPSVSISANKNPIVLPDNSATLTGTVNANGGSSLALAWSEVSGPSVATFSSPTQTATQVTLDAPGTYVFALVASTSQGSATAEITISVGGHTPPVPTTAITAPADSGSITRPTPVTGSVTLSGGSWTLAYSPTDANGNATNWTTFATGSNSVQSGSLGTLDPTLLLNGEYSLRLQAVDSFGQSSMTVVTVDVERNMKVGNFTLSFNDLSVPMPGLPIQITRTYDSRNKSQGDFGIGWTLSIANVRLQVSHNLAQNWSEDTTWTGLLPQYCLTKQDNSFVTATFPDGRVYKFQPVSSPQCQAAGPITAPTLAFIQVPTGSNTAGASLTPADGGSVLIDGSVPGPENFVDYSGNPYSPTQFLLTTADGFTYTIDRTLGVTQVKDTNGNTLTINAGGILSSAGKSVAFLRDSQGRITQIQDPAGNTLSYVYDSTGNLSTFTDAAGNKSTYSYDNNHYLTGIQDPRGVQAIRNNYDSSGRLLSTTDANGNTINYNNANITGQTETITDRLGNPTTYTYDGDGNITSETDALGNTTSYTYDANDNKLSETNPFGKTTNYTYDGNGNRLTETDPLGNATTYTYNARNQVLTVTDPQSHTTTNVYDNNGNLTSTTDANGKTTSTVYNSNGTPSSVTDANSNTTQFQYDGSGNLTQQTDALTNVTTYTYDANGNKLSQTVTRTVNGQQQTITTGYKYDGNNRLTETDYADGTKTQVQYNSIGKQSVTIDQLNRQTTYTYDADGRLKATTYPDNSTEAATYDAENDRLTSTDRAGNTTTYTYDADKRLTKTTYADHSFTQTNYDAAGRVSSTIDANNNKTTYIYDDAGRRTSITDALNHATAFAYDAAGNQISVKDANQNLTQYQYDSLNRQIKVIYPDQTFSSTAYDALGRVSSKTDQAGKVTGYGYDALGRLTSVTQDAVQAGLNLVTAYGYDEVGNRISQTDANNHTTMYGYDQLGRRISRTLPAGQTENYTYDAAGNLQTKIDFRRNTSGYAYDSSNRLIAKSSNPSVPPTITFTYLPNGLRQTMADLSGTTTYTYDNRNRLTSKQTPFGTLSYTYDAAGNVLTIKSSNVGGISDTYTYDALNRLSTVVDSSGQTTYTYDNVGNLQGYAYPNGVVTSYNYDQLNRLTQDSSQAQGSAVASYTYTLGAAGNRLTVAELSGRTVNYGYDSLYRLTSETASSDPHAKNGTVGYTYDAVGNRLTLNSTLPPAGGMTYSYDANDRLNSEQYDANGNMTFSNNAGNIYDFENHLTNHVGVFLTYDGDGNRVVENNNGIITNYLVDTNNPTGYAQVVDELQNGSVVKSYSYGLERISQRPTTNGQGLSFYGYDGHGSVRFLTNSAGAVTDTYDYDAFGNLINSTGSTPNNYLFAGEQYDPALGVYYNRARYLNTNTGRFWTMDAYEGRSEDPITIHKYTYTAGDPVDRIDPRGRDFDVGTTVAVAGISGALSGAIIGGITSGTRGAIHGAIEGAVFGTVFALGGAGIGSALLGSAARGVFITGIGGLIGSAGVSTYSAITATTPEERNRALLGLAFTAAFAYFGPKVLEAANTQTFQAEYINDTYFAGKQPSYTPGTIVSETTIFKPATYIRFYTEGSTNPVGAWLADPTEVAGLTAEEAQSALSLPFKPTHIETVTVPAGTTFRVGYANPDAFGGTGGGLQFELLQHIPTENYGPGVPFP